MALPTFIVKRARRRSKMPGNKPCPPGCQCRKHDPRPPIRPEDHSRWRGDDAGVHSKRMRAARLFPFDGAECTWPTCTELATDRHHKDGDPGNNVKSNIEFLCHRHHTLSHNLLARLTRESVGEIRSLVACGQSYTKIGLLFKVHRQTISDIANRRTWRDVE